VEADDVVLRALRVRDHGVGPARAGALVPRAHARLPARDRELALVDAEVVDHAAASVAGWQRVLAEQDVDAVRRRPQLERLPDELAGRARQHLVAKAWVVREALERRIREDAHGLERQRPA